MNLHAYIMGSIGILDISIFNTDQAGCYSATGHLISCADTGQEGAVRGGLLNP
jgi:hypothetical protein